MNERNMKKRGFFMRITRKEATEEIKKFEEAVGRNATAKEKHVIINRVAKKSKLRTLAWALALFVGIGAGALLEAGKNIDKGEGLDNPTGTELNADDDAILKEDGNKFKEDLKVDVSYQGPNSLEVNPEVAQLHEEIDNIESKEDILNWFKTLYANEYENVTGIDVNPSTLSFIKSEHANLYQAGDQYITRGSYPDITKGKITSNGEEVSVISQLSNFDVYTMTGGGITNKVLDGMTYIKNGASFDANPLILGDSYEEMKENTNSILANMGKIPQEVIELYDLYSQLGPNNYEYINNLISSSKQDLKELVSNYMEGQTIDENTQQVEDDERV